jgi:hypothetical protein
MRPGEQKLHGTHYCQSGSRQTLSADLAHGRSAGKSGRSAQPLEHKRFTIFPPRWISGILFVVVARTDFNKHNNDPAVEERSS